MIFIILGSIPFIAYIKYLSGKKNIFYTDTQIQETFIESAQEKSNLLALAYNLGYKPVISNPSFTNADFYLRGSLWGR